VRDGETYFSTSKRPLSFPEKVAGFWAFFYLVFP